MEKKLKIVASFDDADNLTMRLAELLVKYQIPTVFYVPILTREISDHQVRQLAGTLPNCEMCKITSKLFEIGGHSITHPREFNKLCPKDLQKEVQEGKRMLESIIRTNVNPKYEVTKFCYPRGRYNDDTIAMVKKAGFKEARTVKGLDMSFAKDPFRQGPTIHVHAEHQMYGTRVWKEVAEELFDKVLLEGGRFEIWGHAWEIEKYNQWEFLEDFLWYMDSRMKEINYPRDPRIDYITIK
jgi:peptidoglycan/xylan/chitin deacetylase (PgdA/CDA1 family)